MSNESDNNEHDKSAGFKVKLIKLASSLRIKGGASEADNRPGAIPQEAINEADKIIKDICKTCPETVGQHLEELEKLWSEMLDTSESEAGKELAQRMYVLAHEIKDVTAMCGYELNAYFSESLRDYIGGTDLQVAAQRVIIQAHLDAMHAVHKQGIKEDGGPVADELKRLVKVAIDQHRLPGS